MLYVISNPTKVTLIHWVCIYNLIIMLRLISTGTSSHSAEDHLLSSVVCIWTFPISQFWLNSIKVAWFWIFLPIIVPFILPWVNDFPFYYRIKLFYIKRQFINIPFFCSFLGSFICQLITSDVNMARYPFKNNRFVMYAGSMHLKKTKEEEVRHW